MTKKKAQIKYVALCIIFLLQLCFLLYTGMQKAGFNIDDILSYELSNGYYLPFLELSSDFYNEWHGADYFMQSLVTSTDTQFQYRSVYSNQTLDVHPPLYYAVFHTVSSIFTGTFSKWIGLGVNFVFFLGTSLLLFLLSKLFFRQTVFQLLPVILWGFSIGAASTFLLIRMYTMLCFLVTLYLYVHLRYISGQKMTIWRCFAVMFCTGAGFLTHYYFLIFAFFLTATECLVRLGKKQVCQAFLHGGSSLLAVILSFVVYPAAYYHIFAGYRGQESMQSATAFSEYFTRIAQVGRNISVSACAGLVASLCILVLLLLCVILPNSTKWVASLRHLFTPQTTKSSVVLLSLPTGLTFFTISILAAYNGERYLYYLYPLSALNLVLLLALALHTPALTQRIKYLLATAVVVGLLAIGWIGNEPTYLELESGTAIENAATYQDASCIFLNDNIWKFVGHYIELTQYQQVLFLKTSEMELANTAIISSECEYFIVYLPRGAEPADYLSFFEPLGYCDFQPLWSYSYSDVYLLAP